MPICPKGENKMVRRSPRCDFALWFCLQVCQMMTRVVCDEAEGGEEEGGEDGY